MTPIFMSVVVLANVSMRPDRSWGAFKTHLSRVHRRALEDQNDDEGNHLDDGQGYYLMEEPVDDFDDENYDNYESIESRLLTGFALKLQATPSQTEKSIN